MVAVDLLRLYGGPVSLAGEAGLAALREEDGGGQAPLKIAEPLDVRAGEQAEGGEDGDGEPGAGGRRGDGLAGAHEAAELGIERGEAFPSGIPAPAQAAGYQRLAAAINGEQGAVNLYPEGGESRDGTAGGQEGPAGGDRSGVERVEAVD